MFMCIQYTCACAYMYIYVHIYVHINVDMKIFFIVYMYIIFDNYYLYWCKRYRRECKHVLYVYYICTYLCVVIGEREIVVVLGMSNYRCGCADSRAQVCFSVLCVLLQRAREGVSSGAVQGRFVTPVAGWILREEIVSPNLRRYSWK